MTGDWFGDPLHEFPSGVQRVDQPTDLRAARQLVIDVAAAYGLDSERCAQLALAVDEIATNAICHGGRPATVSAYDGEGAVTVDIHDNAPTQIPAPPSTRPPATAIRGRGLWLARQLCDRVEIRRHETGNDVRLVMML
jgi:anti-sigma regulatory factor (Ser/Thr protein kinase)